MLVAQAPAQTATYQLMSSVGTSSQKLCPHSPHPKPIVSNASSTSSSDTVTVNSHNNNHKPGICESSSSTSGGNSSGIIRKLTGPSALMKTLSVSLNRSTEFLKDTVAKALISNSANSKEPDSKASDRYTTCDSGGSGTPKTLTAFIKSRPTFGFAAAAGLDTNKVVVQYTARASTSIASATTEPKRNNFPNPYSALTKSINKASFAELCTIPPTIAHRYPEERMDTTSVDSLQNDLCHFKPIRSVPITAVKCNSKSRGVSLKLPLAIRTASSLNCDYSRVSEVIEEKGPQGGSLPRLRITPFKPFQDWSPKRSAFVSLSAQFRNPGDDAKPKTTTKKAPRNKARGKTKASNNNKANNSPTTTATMRSLRSNQSITPKSSSDPPKPLEQRLSGRSRRSQTEAQQRGHSKSCQVPSRQLRKTRRLHTQTTTKDIRSSRSPPLTRARLKQKFDVGLLEPLEVKKRGKYS